MAVWIKEMELTFLSVFLLLLHHGREVKTQVAWTPIYVDGNSQVDLWTVSNTGCSCTRNDVNPKQNYFTSTAAPDWRAVTTEISTENTTLTSHASSSPPPLTPASDNCACCVKDGGCPCGSETPQRCAQCGLEAHCTQMCNVTLDSKQLKTRSGKNFGQIKSPSIMGPGSCWYLFLADRNQRIEVQVYRLVSVGHFNGTSCQSGYLELSDSPEANDRKGKVRSGGLTFGSPPTGGSGRGLQLCGENERFTPPAVIFADRSSATLLLQVGEPTLRSQFLAYFSFTPSDHRTLGIASRGGKRVDNTECDWIYQEHLCRTKKGGGGGRRAGKGKEKSGVEDGGSDAGGCVLASPGYPGIYPPNRVCKYLVIPSSSETRVNLTFTNLLLPHSHCESDYVVIRKGSTKSSKVLTKICGTRKTQFELTGSNIIIEFRSGHPVPPYNYNGFRARLEFVDSSEDPSASLLPLSSSPVTVEPELLMDDNRNIPKRIPNTICDYVYYGNTTRSGQFDTRTKGLQTASNRGHSSITAPITCKLVFYGRSSDKVYLSLFNFDLRAPACESSIEIFDGKGGKNSKCIQKICSPFTKKSENGRESFSENKSIVSTGNVLTIVFYRALDASKEYIEGSFLFHNERSDGALQPSTLCDVVFDGSKRRGRDSKKEEPFAEPVAGRSHQSLRNVEGPLRCSQKFDLDKSQTITLKITSGERLVHDPHCYTRCQTENGGGGIMDEDIGGGCSCMTDSIPL